MTNAEVNAKARELGELLQSNGFNANDMLSIAAIASVLVSACVYSGVTKKSFFGTLRDLWRRGVIQRDTRTAEASAPSLTDEAAQPNFESMNTNEVQLSLFPEEAGATND